jgi:DNA-binding XRE family transcriptional regulator
MDRIKLNLDKLKHELPTMNDYLNNLYGAQGTPARDRFNKEAIAFYCGELIKGKRLERKMTQQQLANRIGKERAYIAKLEQGKTDLQVSNFIQIINALGLSFEVV